MRVGEKRLEEQYGNRADEPYWSTWLRPIIILLQTPVVKCFLHTF